MNAKPLQALEIQATELFADPEFAEWLNRRTGKGLATWHTGGPPGEFSDVFVIYDNGEGDESSDKKDTGMPEKCWQKICDVCEAEKFDYGIVRLLNC